MKLPVVIKLSEVGNNILYKVGEHTNFHYSLEVKPKLQFEKFPMSYDKYLIAFENVMDAY